MNYPENPFAPTPQEIEEFERRRKALRELSVLFAESPYPKPFFLVPVEGEPDAL